MQIKTYGSSRHKQRVQVLQRKLWWQTNKNLVILGLALLAGYIIMSSVVFRIVGQ